MKIKKHSRNQILNPVLPSIKKRKILSAAAFVGFCLGLLFGGPFSLTPVAHGAPELLACTNAGEVVEIDLSAGTATLVGSAVIPVSNPGWSGLAFDQAGNLFTVTRTADYDPADPFAHLYRVDPDSGEILAHVGDTGVQFISDIAFSADGTLYGTNWVSGPPYGLTGLVKIDLETAETTTLENLWYGSGPFHPYNLQVGGLAVHPGTDEIWSVESSWSPAEALFKIDQTTGLGSDTVRLGLDGQPTDFGFSGLAILPDGKFIATRARGRDGTPNSARLYEIDPIPQGPSDLAEVTMLPLDVGPGIVGSINGLTVIPPIVPVEQLINDVIDLDLQQGTSNDLEAKLDAVSNALDDVNQNNDVAAINSLQAFINAVEAQRGKKLTDEQATALVEAAQEIIDSLSSGYTAPARQGRVNPVGKSTTAWGKIKNMQ